MLHNNMKQLILRLNKLETVDEKLKVLYQTIRHTNISLSDFQEVLKIIFKYEDDKEDSN